MADQLPNYALERKRLEVQIGQNKQNRLATELRIMTLENDLAQANLSLEAIDAAIVTLEEQADTLMNEEKSGG